MRPFLSLGLLLASVAPAIAAPDTLVVCPQDFRAALAPWVELRREQGHELEIIAPAVSAAELRAAIRHAAASGKLEYLVLIGDVPTGRANRDLSPAEPVVPRNEVPTNFVPAAVNTRWGSEPTIASDIPFADVDGDGTPDLAIGRIPARSAAELAAVVGKIVRYEGQPAFEAWDRQLSALAGGGGFGPLADSLIEAAGQQIMNQAVPPGFVVNLSRANTAGRAGQPAMMTGPDERLGAAELTPFSLSTRRQINAGSLAWVYVGHGNRTTLDFVPGPRGPEPILSLEDVPHLRCAGHCPVAMLIACYTGAFDGPTDSLAEKMLLAEEGPVAVVASTRMSMPYGNTVFGYELLRASLAAEDRPSALGAALRLAQRRTLTPPAGDSMRRSFDALAMRLSPLLQPVQPGVPRWQPADLALERGEHVAMYHLLGDPLLRWRRPAALDVAAPAEIVPGEELTLRGRATFAGTCRVELAPLGAVASGPGGAGVLTSVTKRISAGDFRITLPVPASASGRLIARVALQGDGNLSVGGANVTVRPIEPAGR
jgi:hypothetical protein